MTIEVRDWDFGIPRPGVAMTRARPAAASTRSSRRPRDRTSGSSASEGRRRPAPARTGTSAGSAGDPGAEVLVLLELRGDRLGFAQGVELPDADAEHAGSAVRRRKHVRGITL